MFGSKKQETKQTKAATSKIDTLIGQSTEIRGDVIFTGGLHVDGTIKGNVLAEQDSGSVLSLSESGHIEGEIRVPNIVLNGSVEGDVYASEHIELAVKARVKGNVYYSLIEMARGAEVNGNLVHRANDAPAVQTKPAAVAAAVPKTEPKEPAKVGEGNT